MTNAKPWYLSKGVWGALMTLLAVFGLSAYGISFDADTLTLHIQLDTLAEKIVAGTGVLGFVLQFVGRLVAKSRLKW